MRFEKRLKNLKIYVKFVQKFQLSTRKIEPFYLHASQRNNMPKSARLMKELRMLEMDPPHGVAAWPINDQINHLRARKFV